MTKGCIFGFDLVGVSRERKKSVFGQIDFYAPPTDFDSAIRQCSPAPLYIYNRSFHSPTAPNPGPSRQRFTLFRFNIIYILYCYTGIYNTVGRCGGLAEWPREQLAFRTSRYAGLKSRSQKPNGRYGRMGFNRFSLTSTSTLVPLYVYLCL